MFRAAFTAVNAITLFLGVNNFGSAIESFVLLTFGNVATAAAAAVECCCSKLDDSVLSSCADRDLTCT